MLQILFLVLLSYVICHYWLSAMTDYLQEKAKGSTVYGFKGGPAGIMKCKYVELTPEFVYPFRNQVAKLEINMSICLFLKILIFVLNSLVSLKQGGFDMICSGRDKIETPQQVNIDKCDAVNIF